MIITNLKRNQLRYIMFRLRTGQTEKSARLTAKNMQALLAGWGHDVSRAKAKQLLADIQNHYEGQIYFTGWEHFAAEVTAKKTGTIRGTNKSWDIGMVDGDGTPESQIMNIARMVNRPHKWFLFGIHFTEAVSTRGLVNTVTGGWIITLSKISWRTVLRQFYAIQGFIQIHPAQVVNLITETSI